MTHSPSARPGLGRGLRRGVPALGAMLLLGVLLSAVAHGQAQVFHSPGDDGSASCGGGPCPFADELFIWASAPVPECEGDGCTCSDVCAVDTLVEVEGGSFAAIDATPGVIVQPTCVDSATPCTLPGGTVSLHLVASFAGQEEFQTGPRRLARVVMTPGAAPNATAVSVNGIGLVNAGFSLQTLGTNLIALPEPSLPAALLAGGALLLGLRRRPTGAPR